MPTVEVRWFRKGDIQPDVWQRFLSGTIEQNDAVEKRSDIYLCLPGVEDLGIKLRGKGTSEGENPDTLEIKRHQVERGMITFTGGATGKLEHWNKWGFSEEAGTPQLSAVLTDRDRSWINVHKTRCTRKYTVASNGKGQSLSLKEHPAYDCNVELTILSAKQRSWWTLGLEALGPSMEIIENQLKLIAEHIFAETHLNTFKAEHSYSYPKWLQTLT